MKSFGEQVFLPCAKLLDILCVLFSWHIPHISHVASQSCNMRYAMQDRDSSRSGNFNPLLRHSNKKILFNICIKCISILKDYMRSYNKSYKHTKKQKRTNGCNEKEKSTFVAPSSSCSFNYPPTVKHDKLHDSKNMMKTKTCPKT